jgi:hypothetical protein
LMACGWDVMNDQEAMDMAVHLLQVGSRVCRHELFVG